MTDTELRGTLLTAPARTWTTCARRPARVGAGAAGWGSPSPAPPRPCPHPAEEKHLHVRSTSRLISRFDFASFPLRAAEGAVCLPGIASLPGDTRPGEAACSRGRQGPSGWTPPAAPHHVQRSRRTSGRSLPLAGSRLPSPGSFSCFFSAPFSKITSIGSSNFQ